MNRPHRHANERRLAIEAAVIAGLIGLGALLVYVFVVHTIRNTRPLGGANRDVSPLTGSQSEAAFAIDPRRPSVLVGLSDDLRTYTSTDGGLRWRRGTVPGACGRGAPRVVVGANGREYAAYLLGSVCGDQLTPYVVVTSRAGPAAPWSRPVRITGRAWRYGFDDAPSIAVDPASGRLYVAWTRSLSVNRATVVVGASGDGGRTWSPPLPVSPSLVHPHLASVAVGPGGVVYVAGFDARGLWLARSGDGGRSFGRPRRAPLRDDPAADCGTAGLSPLPQEWKACAGPNPTVLTQGRRVLLVYDDAGSNGSPDVELRAFDDRLRPLFRETVNPPDRGHAQQFDPAAAVDPTTGDLWACWYDTTFDPHAHRAWFTCSDSRDGRLWSAPERAAAVPTATDELSRAASLGGLYASVVAAHGVAHAFWPDGRVIDNLLDVYTAALPARAG